MHIDDVVAGLLSPSNEATPLLRVEFVIRLAMWLRYSGQSDLYEAAVLAGFLSYVRIRHKNVRLADLPKDELGLLQRNLSIDTVASIYLGENYNVPDFELFAEYNNGHHDFLYIADIVRFLIWYTPKTNDKRSQASLQKAYFYIKAEGFANIADRSRRWLVEKWAQHKNASSLLYVSFYHSDHEFLLDPRKRSFRAQVDELAKHPTALIDMLLRAKWVGERIRQRLHSKAKDTLRLPIFPADAGSLEIPEVLLEDSVYRCLEKYDPMFEETP